MTFRNIFIIIALTISSLGLYGQSVTLSDSLEYDIGIKIAGSRMSGVFNRSSFSFGAEKHVHLGKWNMHNNLSYRHSVFNGFTVENNWYDLFSVFYYPDERKLLYPLAFYHFDNNLLFRVNNRHRGGVGVGSNLLESGGNLLQVYGGWGYETTNYNGSLFINSDLDNSARENGLFICYVNCKNVLLKSKFLLELNIFYMQSLKEDLDYDIWFRPSLQYLITKNITLFANYDYRLENVYLEDLTAANDILVFGLNVEIANTN